MEPTRDNVLQTIYASIDEVNEQLAREEWLEKSPEMALLGPSASLDSLGFVNFIAIVEEKCESRFGSAVSLSESYQTVGELADLLSRRLSEKAG